MNGAVTHLFGGLATAPFHLSLLYIAFLQKYFCSGSGIEQQCFPAGSFHFRKFSGNLPGNGKIQKVFFFRRFAVLLKGRSCIT